MERQVVEVPIFTKQQNDQKQVQIQIRVGEPLLYEKDVFNYFTYNIAGEDRNGPFLVRRRYSDFDLLRKRLSQNWLGIYLPPLPGKRADKNPFYFLTIFESKANQIKYAQSRCKFLKYFCQGIVQRRYIYYCDLFHIFIRGGPNYESAIQKCKVRDNQSMLEQYEAIFHDLILKNENEVLQEQLIASEDHFKILKYYEDNLKGVCQKIHRASQAREQFNQQFSSTMKKTLPEYEQTFLLKHLCGNREKLIITKDQQFAVKLTQFEKLNAINPLERFSNLVVYEIREIKALIEAIQGRKSTQKLKVSLKQKVVEKQNEIMKIESGSFSLRTFFNFRSKQSQINELKLQIQLLKNQIITLQKLIVIMIINGNFQIQQYRNKKSKQFKEVFRSVAQEEIVELQALKQLLEIPLSIVQ